MKAAAVLRAVGFSLRLSIFLVVLAGLGYVTTAVWFWCETTVLVKGLVSVCNIGIALTVWLTIVMRPRS